MKKLMTFICVGFLSASAFADCGLSYDIAAKRRHKIDTVVAWVVSFGALTFLDSYESNRFDQLIDMFKDSQAGRLNGDYTYELNQVVKHSIKKAQLVRTKQLEQKVLALINEGYEKEIFCPIKKIENGVEKRAVFGQHAIMKYVAEKLP